MRTKAGFLVFVRFFVILCTVLCIFVGCSSADDLSDDEMMTNPDSLRADLVMHEWNGLRFYLSGEFETVGDADQYEIQYENVDNTMYVRCSRPDDIDGSFSSVQEFIDLYIDWLCYEQFEIIENSEANGTPYIFGHSDEDGGTYGVIGFYCRDGFARAITVSFKNVDLKNEAIKYATLGIMVDFLVEEEPDISQPAVGGNVEWNGLKFILPSGFSDYSDDYYGVFINNSEGIHICVEGFSVGIEYGSDVTSANLFMDAWIDDYWSPSRIVEMDTANGCPYIYMKFDDGFGVAGFYYHDGYGWMVQVTIDDENHKDEAIAYATQWEIVGVSSDSTD